MGFLCGLWFIGGWNFWRLGLVAHFWHQKLKEIYMNDDLQDSLERIEILTPAVRKELKKIIRDTVVEVIQEPWFKEWIK